MIQMQSVLAVADNSGAKKIACINLHGGSKGKYAHVGDIITASVKEASPDGNVKKGQVIKAVIVRTASPRRRRTSATACSGAAASRRAPATCAGAAPRPFLTF